MFRRQDSPGSVVCPACGKLVGAKEPQCPYCGRPRPGMWGLTPLLRGLSLEGAFVPLVVGGSVVVFLATLAFDPSAIGMGGGMFGLLSPGRASLFVFGASGAEPVFRFGRWWTLLSATWLHGGLIHILFNMMAIRAIAPAVVHLYGPGRTTILYVVSGATGFAMSSLSPFLPGLLRLVLGAGTFTVGASAALFGLLGALLHYSRRGGVAALGQQIWVWVGGMLLLGLVLRGIDNWAHIGGLAGGWLLAYWLDPLQPERVDHMLVGLLLLLASLAAIGISVLTGLPLVR
ncbi:MAG TPA: rhomboid family intramembrane serine protease [Thermoanaerobaculia bacterium]|nr:rhomboid family intramembrane serine protease [Thermoanaerobaculia bacterium]